MPPGRPLRLSEIVEVLATENGGDGGFCPEERLPDPADMMVICSSLISCNAVSDDEDNDDESIAPNKPFTLSIHTRSSAS